MQLVWVLDCAEPEALAGFWSAVLGYRAGPWEPPYVSLTDPSGRRPELLLQQVPEPKAGKNRMHLDLRVAGMEPELARLRALGARVVREPFEEEGWCTAVLADPEGNEFCVVVPPEGPDREAAAAASSADG
ncbi:VOC family protein [Streptacidiphilus sp. ASG 303]|uniref:VOC family protein n=1 Tax=Streptomycetaceae TaxID=2062 RepID=UPI001E5F6B14|nr:VOC family protein [Streptacidiphilus sp. ASG 303]MCD0483348.1 VOC family protein [Streptacidiphilus sp. ASG 303]